MDSRRSRREFLKSVGLGAAGLALPGCARLAGEATALGARPGRPATKPNFVLILVDDLGWMDTGCYGSRYYETPNIDRLASQGMRFTDGYAACAVCSPTRAAVMTGRYPARVGVTDWIRPRFRGGKVPVEGMPAGDYVGGRKQRLLCPRNPYWMELDEVTIAEALRPAGYVSCHVGKWHLGPDDWYPERQGFDLNYGGCEYGQPPSYFDPYANGRFPQGIPTLAPRRKGEYLTDREGDEAARFIREHADRPFFLYMAHYAVHTPIQGREDLVEKYRSKTPTSQKNPTYAAMVEGVDHAVGAIMSALDEAGVADNTLVIFTSDNGGLTGPTSNLPLRAGKGHPYEGGIREPVIVRWPGVVEAGSECSVPVTSVDYFPTLCEAAGVPLPADRTIDGESLTQLLARSGALRRGAIFWHFPHYRGRIVPYSIVRAGEWKLIKRYEGRRFELYNLRDDLSEKRDLAGRMPERVEALDAKLVAWLAETGARMPKPNPDYRGKA